MSRVKRSWEGFKEIVSSAKSNARATEPPVEEIRFLEIPIDSSMETIMNELIKKMRIENSVWQLSQCGAYHQVSFSIESDHRHETVLNILSAWGIGERPGSSVSMIPCAIYNRSNGDDENEANQTDDE